MSSARETSPCRPTTRRPPAPIDLTAASSASRPRATIATSAPDAANRVATANPIPLLPPVTMAVRPTRLMSIRSPQPVSDISRRGRVLQRPRPRGKAPGGKRWRRSATRLGYDPSHDARPRMEFTALFLAATVVMLVAWWGSRALALALFAATLVASIATYLHHASDVLKLSF